MTSPAAQTALDVLVSIDTTLKAILNAMRAAQPKEVASDADLNGQYGDPLIRAKDPRDWTGPSMMGLTLSQCPPEYLDLWAERMDFFADDAERTGQVTTSGKPVAPYNRKDAARARGWAKRIRDGWKPPTAPPLSAAAASGMNTANPFATPGAPDQPVADDIPF